MDYLTYLEKESLDFTLAFKNLVNLFNGDKSFFKETSDLDDFISRWKGRVSTVEHLNKVNPLYIQEITRFKRLLKTHTKKV